MKRVLLAILLLPILLVTAACRPTTPAILQFSDGAKALPPIDVSDAKWAAENVTVYEPYELHNVEFRGVPAPALLDSVYGAAWRKGQIFSMTALDGYVSTVPVSRFLGHKAWFAFARTDRPAFTLDKQVPKVETVSLGPVYLVWDSVHDATVRAEGDHGWPYQLATVKLTTFADAFPGLAPPEPGTPDAAAGFELFTAHCAACHSLDGHGGKVGPELNAPHSVTEYWQPQWLHQWIDNPQSVRKGTAMPGLPTQVPERQKAIDQIIAYLKAMTHGP
jgi:cytochrome c2